jgi:hypothetical protein
MQRREAGAMVEPRLTAAEAASQIVSLINSRPATPWPHEIEAIIARAAVPERRTAALDTATPALAAAFAEWDAVRLRFESGEDLGDDAYRELDHRLAEKTEALFAIGARTFADLQLLLPAVLHWNSPIEAGAPDYPECAFAEGLDKAEGQDGRSVAHFIRVLRDLLGNLSRADGGPNLSTDYADFVAAANRTHAFGKTGPKECGPDCDAWEEQFSKLGNATSDCAERILKSANPDPRALAAIIWHFIADASLERGVDLANLPEPMNFGIGQDAAVLLAAFILQGRG